MFRRHGRQHGQVAVLFAVGSLALVGMVGLVLMAGLLFWNQRQLQSLADGAALAGAVVVPQACSGSTPISAADQFMAQQLGATSNSVPPSWTCGTAVTFSYGNSVTATYTYPWNNHPYEIAVKVTRAGIPLQFGAFIGTSQATVSGRAVAQHNYASLPRTFALFVQNGGICSGSSQQAQNPKIDVRGSIYSDALLNWSGNCGYYAHDTIAFDNTEDYGDVLVYPDGQSWAASSGSCTSPFEQSICADGFELSGHVSPTCGNPPWGGVTPYTEYLTDTTSQVPDPCAGLGPPVPNLNETNYQGTEPNSDSAIASSIGGACSPTGAPDGTSGRSALLKTSSPTKTYGYGPAPTSVSGVEHFKPGCYGFLDIGTYICPNGSCSTVKPVVLDPGFYYFNGYDSTTTGGGLCLTKTNSIVLGTDVTLEFVNGTSFSTTACSSTPTSSCGSSITCDFGQGIMAPSAPTLTVSTPGTTLPAGTYSFEVTYLDSAGGETTASSATNATVAVGGQVAIATTGAPLEASKMAVYLVSYTGGGSVNVGYLGTSAISQPGGNASFTYSSPTQGDYTQPPNSNTALLWLAAPPTSPEPPPPSPTVGITTGIASNLPAGTYTFAITYLDPEGETTASSTAQVVMTTANQDIQVNTLTAPQGVTEVKFYLTAFTPATTGTVNRGYIGQLAAPDGTSTTPRYITFSSATHGTGVMPPTSNTTSSAWCSAYLSDGVTPRTGWTATDAAICANRLIWAPPANCTCGLSQIGGMFYVKGPGENSAMLGNIYWPGPAGSQPTSNGAGCNYDANGVGGLLGQVICDSLAVQGGAQSASAAIGYTTGAKFASPPEISLVE